MKIGYVCTNFNNSSFTVKAVATLRANTGHKIEIVVVDNGSDQTNQTTLRELAASEPTTHVIFSQVNVGYFRGLNLGIKHLRTLAPEITWIVIGNNDLEFPPDFCDRVESNAKHWQTRAVISPDIVTLDGEHQNPHVISHISKVRELMYDVYFSNYYIGLLTQKLAMKFRRISDRRDEEYWQSAQPIYQGHGSCYLLSPTFFKYFDELWAPTFLMSEEYFLAKQLIDVGQKVYYDPAIRVIHHWHGALEQLPSRKRWELSRKAHWEYRKHVKLFG